LGLHDKSVEEKYTTEMATNPSGYPKNWSFDKHTIADELTDGFGDIKFGSKGTYSKFLRVEFNTHVESVISILFDCWKLYRPSIIISVTGGAKNFNVKSNLRNILKRGIVKAAVSTG
jgi:transient receptor potential cation channel subfamily M protein 2